MSNICRFRPDMVAYLQEILRNQWRPVRLTNVGRTFRTPRILEKSPRCGYKQPLRQIVITYLGYDKPALLITHQMEVSAAKLIGRYARRTIIESTLADAIDFFHMEALSSAVPRKIELYLRLTLLASNFYRLLTLWVAPGMEPAKPCILFQRLLRNRA